VEVGVAAVRWSGPWATLTRVTWCPIIADVMSTTGFGTHHKPLCKYLTERYRKLQTIRQSCLPRPEARRL